MTSSTHAKVFTTTFEQGLEVAGLTDVGRKRSLNEDNFCIDNELQLLLVADGMGGHHKGEVASAEAVSIIPRFLHDNAVEIDPDRTLINDYSDIDSDTTKDDMPPPVLANIVTAVQTANHVIYTLNTANGFADGQGMGTTVVGLWAPRYGYEAIVFHVGDSRLYLYRKQKLSRLTTDHTLGQQWLDNGLPGPAATQNVITRAVGPSAQVAVETSLHTLTSGDVILLCSDGLTAMLTDDELSVVLARLQSASLAGVCQDLVSLANERGGKDNITVILARYP